MLVWIRRSPSRKAMNIRFAEDRDIPALMRLLLQVNNVHADIRPDIFLRDRRKYTQEELKDILSQRESTPVFVAEEGDRVLGYAFCIRQRARGENLVSHDTLYLDDLCVDECAREKGVGSSLYRHLLCYAKEKGYYNLTLNVWEGNEGAISFYRSRGMKILKTQMEQIL